MKRSIPLLLAAILSPLGHTNAMAAEEVSTAQDAGASPPPTPVAPVAPPSPSAAEPQPTPTPPEVQPLTSTSSVPVPPPPPRWLPHMWRFTANLGALSLPRPVNVEALAAYARPGEPRWDLFAFGLEFGYLPPGLVNFGGPSPTPSDTLSIIQIGAQARWYPWRFVFVGMNLGWQWWRDDATNFDVKFVYVTSSAFVTPRVGLLYRLHSGWELGADLGATLRVTHSTSFSPYDGDSDAAKLTNAFSLAFIPELTLGRIGYTF